MSKGKVLVIDDEPNILKMIELSLTAQDYEAEAFSSPVDALNRAREKYFDAAFIDLKMIPMDGIETLTELKRISPDTTAVLMTAHSSIETAVEAIKKGAYDYIQKPFDHKEFSHTLERVFKYHNLQKEALRLKAQLAEMNPAEELVAVSYSMREIIKTALDIADSNIPVLIEGESGTGKEAVARFIHMNSSRRDNPFIPINCAAIPENLFESELFGHTKGAFTGAVRDRTGKIETADTGVLFLDETAEMPKSMQVKLLRFLQNMEFERVGESFLRKVDVRVISATNKDINKALASGELRDDFFYRISAVRIKIPPLRDRKEDILSLAENILKKISQTGYEIVPETIELMKLYDWPGNIRELENTVKRMAVLAKDRILRPDLLPFEIQRRSPKKFIEIMPKLEEIEKNYILEVLKTVPNPKQAAQILGISETTLWRKRKQYEI